MLTGTRLEALLAKLRRALDDRGDAEAAEKLSREVVAFVQRLRQVELYKQPGIAETIEWARALMQLDALVLDPAVIQDTLGVLLKYQDDIARMQGGEAARLLEEVRNAARAPA